jgi:hypothetical protein
MNSLAIATLIAFLISLPALADCTPPQPPSHLPDGATATREEMVSAMQAIRDYETAVKQFQVCADKSQDLVLMQTADHAVDKVRAIADKFNAELFAFKRRNAT